jgi:GT2 family glycosyltransferase/tetratricopeptide (TPR) repeat protein
MATLAACIIVGKNESFELRRLLESIQGDLFDEICVTTTQGDPDVEKVANELATKVSHFTWVDDFSAARNFSFQQAYTSHIMWLDSDDVVKPDNYAKIKELKTLLDKVDMVIMSYNYGHDDQDNPSTVLPRERIARNDQSRIKWHDPIHEYLNMDGGLVITERKDIAVDHYRMRPYNGERNLAIHERVWSAGTMSPRQMFYYAKDLIDSGRPEESIPVFEKYLDGPTDFADNKAVACIRLANYYRDQKNDPETSASYLRRGLTYNSAYAEFYFMLGMYYKDIRKDADAAISYLLQAAGRPMSAGMSMQAEFYEYLPCKHLAFLYFDKQDYQKAMHYCERAFKANPKDPHCAHNIQVIKSAMESQQAALSKIPSQDAPIRIAWMLTQFSAEDPSQRIRRLNVHAEMVSSGKVVSKLFTNYLGVPVESTLELLSGVDVVVFSSYSSKDRELIGALNKAGKKTALDFNEAILDNQAVLDTLKAVDVVVCCSTKLAELVRPLAVSVAVVPDAYEEGLADGERHQYLRPDREKPEALYIGMGGNSFLVTDHLRPAIEAAGYKLRVCTEWDNADVKWSLDSWRAVMQSADVVLCPQRIDVQPAKSNVKVTQAMALGIPVVASGLQAYKEVIRHGWNGYICTGRAEWKAALEELKDPYKRIQVGMNAAGSVSNYSVASVAAMWASVAQQVVQGPPQEDRGEDTLVAAPATREVVPIIIPVYNGVEYLKQCLSSIHMNTTYPYHVILSDAGSNDETWEYLRTLKGITVLGQPGLRRNFSQTCNEGIRNSSGKYFVLLNSDTIVSKGWLEPLVEQMNTGNRLAACGVLSNCDRGWLHGVEGRPQYPMRLHGAGIELVPGMKIAQMSDHLDELDQFMQWSNKQNKGKFVSQQWVAYYATIIARSVVDEIGLLDDQFQNGCEDLDHCYRIQSRGYNIGQRMDSFVYHYGGISRGAYQQEDKDSYNAEDRRNHELYAAKWARKRIAIYTGPAWEKWNRSTVDGGMGGSETWASELAAEFSKMGFDTHVFNDCPVDGEVDRDGVTYHRHEKYLEWSQYLHVDYVILSRTCEPLKHWHLHAGHVSVMVHDIWITQDPNYDTRQWAVNEFGCLSDWHVDFFSKHHKVDRSKIFLTANGVREELYANVDVSAKKNKAVYSSSPDRGLYQLLQMFPRIRQAVPDFELDILYGFYNWEEAAKLRNNPAELQMIEELKAMASQEGVNYIGRVDKKELARRQKESKLWLYPTWFSETFCLTATESGLARNAVVTTPYAGLLTTLGDSPVYIQGPSTVPVEQWCYTPEYQDAFVAEAIKLLTDESYRQACADRVYNKVKGYTWKNAAEGWLHRWGLV